MEESGAKQNSLNEQVRELLIRGETTLHIGKINDIFHRANGYKSTILKKYYKNIQKSLT